MVIGRLLDSLWQRVWQCGSVMPQEHAPSPDLTPGLSPLSVVFELDLSTG